jgi:hypothetical protein
MKYSDLAYQTTTSYAQGLPDGLFDLMRGLTVKLHAKNDTFTATGVIYKVDGTDTWVLTAAHNLHVYAGNDYNSDHEDLADSFKNGMQVVRSTGKNQSTAYDIDELTLDAGDTAYGYDVCSLRIDSLALANSLAGGYLAGGNGFGAVTNRTLDLHGDVPTFVNGKNGLQKWAIFQLGYGKFKKWDNSEQYSLRWRALPWQALKQGNEKPKMMAKTKENYIDVLTFASSDATSTTSVGDSGGPAFLIQKDNNYFRAYLLGVTLGANFWDNKKDKANDPIVNNAVTVLSAGKVAGLTGG